MRIPAYTIGYLSRISLGNVNASHTEGNVMVTKKVTLPDGSTLPYVSGQAIRRMVRDRLAELGFPLSDPFVTVSGQEASPPVRPWEFIDEDLFGYLDASGSRRRTSPVRVSAAIGCFPYQGDRDLGTRSFERFGKKIEEGGNMFETEVYHNVFRGTLLVEMDRVGVFPDLEVENKKEKPPETLEVVEVPFGSETRKQYLLPLEQRRERLQTLVEALRILWGGGRTARLLVDFSPRFLIFAALKAKHPIFLEALQVDYANGQPVLQVEPLEASLERYQPYIDGEVIVGVEPGFLGNEDALKELNPVSISEAIASIKDRVGQWTP